jgi:hypothetical protein
VLHARRASGCAPRARGPCHWPVHEGDSERAVRPTEHQPHADR